MFLFRWQRIFRETKILSFYSPQICHVIWFEGKKICGPKIHSYIFLLFFQIFKHNWWSTNLTLWTIIMWIIFVFDRDAAKKVLFFRARQLRGKGLDTKKKKLFFGPLEKDLFAASHIPCKITKIMFLWCSALVQRRQSTANIQLRRKEHIQT